MRVLKQICSAALSAGLLLSSVMSVVASEESTVPAASEETIESVASEEETSSEYAAAYTGLVNYGGNVWRYQVNGAVQWNYTGLVQYYGTWYYVEKGTLNWGYTGLTNYYGTWYYVENGVLNWGYTGLTNYYGTWYYVENGVLNWGYTGLTNYYGTWYYVENGVLNWSYTSLTNYYGTWYYIEGGVLNWNYTGLAKYYDTWYYIDHGVLNWNYTGFTEYYGTRYHVKNGVLDLNYSGFDLQAISNVADQILYSPLVIRNISWSYERKFSYSYDWNGSDTQYTFIWGDGGRGGYTLKVDLTTGIGDYWYDNASYISPEYEGKVNFANLTGSGGLADTYFYRHAAITDPYVGITWDECGGTYSATRKKYVIDSATNGLLYSCIKGSASLYIPVTTVKYVGDSGRGKFIFALIDANGTQTGYAVCDSYYNYYAVYNMNCTFLAEGMMTP